MEPSDDKMEGVKGSKDLGAPAGLFYLTNVILKNLVHGIDI